MSASDNLKALKAAYAEWDRTKGDNTGVWIDLASDDLRVRSLGGEAVPLQFAEPRGGAQLAGYLAKLLETWQMQFVTPETFVADGDYVAMFGTASWTFRATGKTATTPLAHLWRFRDGKAVDFQELFDSAAVMQVAG